MDDEIDIQKLAAMIRAKRGQKGVREAAREIGGISSSTLSRIEQGKMPDLTTFLRICRWLGVEAEQFVSSSETRREEPAPSPLNQPAIITAHLRADRVLDPKTIEALSTMIRLAYEDAARRAQQEHGQEQQEEG